jgi:rhamnulokinase
LPEAAAFAAVDLGAESGRVVVGWLHGGRIDVEVVHRFPNRPVQLPDGLRWDLLHLFAEALDGLCVARERAQIRSVGIDAWGVDYALLDERIRLLGLPFHHRDARTSGMVERAFARVPREELYATTGIQTLAINTAFQLLAEEGTAALERAAHIGFVPDLFALWMTGELANERTIASTSGLLDARSGEWAHELIARLGLPAAPFGELVEPGALIGRLLEEHAARTGLPAGLPVRAVASHDTASAFAAAPVEAGSTPALLSSGTWSLLGAELDAPVLDERARAFDLTNERGVDGTTRLLKNVMGLWLVQECRRAWADPGHELSYAELQRLAASVGDDVPLFDPDQDAFLAPGDMPARVTAACERTGQRLDPAPAVVVRSILTSLACKYRLVLERLESATGRTFECVHVIGGGSRNGLLCRLTADILGRRVVTGPVEATALGNVLVQARAAGELSSRSDLHTVARASAGAEGHEPRAAAAGDATYERFLALTGLGVEPAAPTPA